MIKIQPGRLKSLNKRPSSDAPGGRSVARQRVPRRVGGADAPSGIRQFTAMANLGRAWHVALVGHLAKVLPMRLKECTRLEPQSKCGFSVFHIDGVP